MSELEEVIRWEGPKSVFDGLLAARAERDALLARCTELETALRETADELDRWRWGSAYRSHLVEDRRVVEAVARARRLLSTEEARYG